MQTFAIVLFYLAIVSVGIGVLSGYIYAFKVLKEIVKK